jgi:hypothetical protein
MENDKGILIPRGPETSPPTHALYRRAVAMLAMDKRNAELPTTDAVRFVEGLFWHSRAGWPPPVFLDVRKTIEKNGGRAPPLRFSVADPCDSREFFEWWRRNMGEAEQS